MLVVERNATQLDACFQMKKLQFRLRLLFGVMIFFAFGCLLDNFLKQRFAAMEASRLQRLDKFFTDVKPNIKNGIFVLEIEFRRGRTLSYTKRYAGVMGVYVLLSETSRTYGLSPEIQSEIRREFEREEASRKDLVK
jgi:hypothetical protein